MLIHSASQLLTLKGGPQRGSRLGELEIIENGAVLIRDSKIADVGDTNKLLEKYPNVDLFDAKNRTVMPGFVDAHTHLVWAGNRASEFEQRLQGRTYLEILEAGGGILSTVEASRTASIDQLVEESMPRAWQAFTHGSTSIEVKTGYGLSLESELKLLEAILRLDDAGPWELTPTFLAAHAIPKEYEGRSGEYVQHVAEDMLPALSSWWAIHAKNRNLPFVDVFCETGAFDLKQSRVIFEAAQTLGFPIKVHADEFDNLGGADLAMELNAISADHLVSTSDKEIGQFGTSNTVAVSLPGTPFGLGQNDYTPAKKIIDADGYLAVASDLNPGTAWGESLQFSLALACRYMGLTPAQSISAATINGAAAIGRDRELGSIEVGKQADLLILKENDYRHLGYRFGTNLVHTVIKQGKTYPIERKVNDID
jgi:imidazolonepropionase